MPKLDFTPATLPRLDLFGQLRVGKAIQEKVDRNRAIVDKLVKLANVGRTSDGEGIMAEADHNREFIIIAMTSLILSRLRNNQSLSIFRH